MPCAKKQNLSHHTATEEQQGHRAQEVKALWGCGTQLLTALLHPAVAGTSLRGGKCHQYLNRQLPAAQQQRGYIPHAYVLREKINGLVSI